MKRIYFLTFLCIISNHLFAQINVSGKHFQIQSKAFKIGVYNPKKVMKNSFNIFYDEQAEFEFEKILQEDEELKKRFVEKIKDDEWNITSIREEEIYKYYPELGIIIKGGGHGFVSVYDMKNKIELCGNPMT